MRDENEEEQRTKWESKQVAKNKEYEARQKKKDQEEELWIAKKEKLMERGVLVGKKGLVSRSVIVPRLSTTSDNRNNNDDYYNYADTSPSIHSARSHRDRRCFTIAAGGDASTQERLSSSLSLTLQGLLDSRLGTKKSPRYDPGEDGGGSRLSAAQGGGSRMISVAERLFSSSRTLHINSGTWDEENQEDGGVRRRERGEGGAGKKKPLKQHTTEGEGGGGEKNGQNEGDSGKMTTTKKRKKKEKKKKQEGVAQLEVKEQKRGRRLSMENMNMREKRKMMRQKSRSLSPPPKLVLERTEANKLRAVSEEPMLPE